jgi:hypothetical protein
MPKRVPDAVATLDLDDRVALAAESALAARDVLDAAGADGRDLSGVEVLPQVLAEVRTSFLPVLAEVLHRLLQQYEVVAERPKSRVAASTEKAAPTAGLMVVILRESLACPPT